MSMRPKATSLPLRPQTIRTKAQREAEREAERAAKQAGKQAANAPTPSATAANAPPDQLTVVVHALRIDALIGVYHHEHGRSQPVEVDVEATLDSADTPRDDALVQTLDYDAICKAATTFATEHHTKLVESLAGKIADWCVAQPRVAHVTVRIRKPQALANAAWAGCTLTRSASPPKD